MRDWSLGAVLGSWFGAAGRISGFRVVPTQDASNGDNGMYGGQLQPCLAFLATLAAVLCAAPHAAGAAGGSRAWDQLVWGLSTRGVACAYTIAFVSLRLQIVGLAGRRGLYPVGSMLERMRSDMPATLPRCVHFPVCWLWWSASDDMLRATCTAGAALGVLAAYGGVASRAALFGSWVCWIVLTAACPLLGYPWDGLLCEVGITCAALLPPLAPLAGTLRSVGFARSVTPSAVGVWALRLLLVRVMFGMGKFKFSRGWMHDENRLYLKWFLSWQPLPTPLAWAMQTRIPDAAWRAVHAAMWLVEVPMPALFLARSWRWRAPAAAATIGLQLSIHLVGNYGLFNVLCALLALPLLATDAHAAHGAQSDGVASGGASDGASDGTLASGGAAPASAWQCVVFGVVTFLGLIELPHNSYSTNAWLHLVPTAQLPPAARRVAEALLTVLRALKPLHLAHGFGVFTPRALRNFARARLVLRVHVRLNGGREWLPLATRFNSAAGGGRLQFFAPHQPRLDHHLFYEGVQVDLTPTVQTNPYFLGSAGLLLRLAQCILDGAPHATRLLLPDGQLPPGATIDAIAMRREWVRFSTPEERRATGAWWVDTPPAEYAAEEVITREAALRLDVTAPPPLAEMALPAGGYWAERAREARRDASARSPRDGSAKTT